MGVFNAERCFEEVGEANGEQAVATNDPKSTIGHSARLLLVLHEAISSSVRGSGGALERIQHPVRDSVVHKIGASAKFQFFVNSFPIGLDGPFTDAEFHCDYLCRKALCDSSQNLSFTPTEPFHLRLAYRASFPPEQHVGDGITQPRIKVSPTAMNRANGFVQLRIGGRSVDISPNTRGKRGSHIARIFV